MTKFYSKETGGFYDTAFHGEKTMQVPDPNWKPATHFVTVKTYVPEKTTEIIDGVEVEKEVNVEVEAEVEQELPDQHAPLITVPNPFCTIPSDAVELSDDEFASSMKGNLEDIKKIESSEDGRPMLVDHPEPTEEDKIASQIAVLQYSITQEKRDKAIFDDEARAWLKDIYAQIDKLRKKLK